MSLELRNAHLARTLAVISLLCPFLLAAIINNRTSWLARIGAALNVALFAGFLLMIISLAF